MDAGRNRDSEKIPKKVEQSLNTFTSVGAQIKDIHWTVGRYDMVLTVEAPSDEALGQATLTMRGAAR